MPPNYWKDYIDLYNIKIYEIGTIVEEILDRYAHMYNEKLGTIKSTEFLIDLKPGTV